MGRSSNLTNIFQMGWIKRPTRTIFTPWKNENMTVLSPRDMGVFWSSKVEGCGFRRGSYYVTGGDQITWKWPSWPAGWLITLLQTDIVMENQSFWWYLPGKMGIFDGYVSLPSLPEGHCSITFFVVVSFLFVVSSIKSNSEYPDWNAT